MKRRAGGEKMICIVASKAREGEDPEELERCIVQQTWGL